MNPAKDLEKAPTKSVQGPLWPFPSLIPWAFLAWRSYPKKDKPDKRIFEVYQKFFLSK